MHTMGYDKIYFTVAKSLKFVLYGWETKILANRWKIYAAVVISTALIECFIFGCNDFMRSDTIAGSHSNHSIPSSDSRHPFPSNLVASRTSSTSPDPSFSLNRCGNSSLPPPLCATPSHFMSFSTLL